MDFKIDIKSIYTLKFLACIGFSRYLIDGFVVSKNRLNSFTSNLNFIEFNFRFIFLLFSIIFSEIKLLNFFVSRPIVDKIIKIEDKDKK